MPEIEHVKNEVLNRVPAEFRPLLNLERLTTFSLDRQREHSADLSMYEAAQVAFEVALRSQYIKGDRKWAAAWRARKVTKHWKALVKASRDAANASEGLRTAYADHVRTVAALPEERRQKALEKAQRRQRGGELAAKSLHKTRDTLSRKTENEEQDDESAGQTPAASPGSPPLRGIGDLFTKKGA